MSCNAACDLWPQCRESSELFIYVPPKGRLEVQIQRHDHGAVALIIGTERHKLCLSLPNLDAVDGLAAQVIEEVQRCYLE